MGGDFRQVGGDFLAKALDPEGPPPAQKTLKVWLFRETKPFTKLLAILFLYVDITTAIFSMAWLGC